MLNTLDRYVLRMLIAPFLFSAIALTMIMLLDQVAKKFPLLVGKGLGPRVIMEVFVLAIPFILAVIVPMAVLAAVLYVFNKLAADNEISAMKASGISLWRIVRPVVVAGLALAVGLVWFNDTVLPNANHRLQQLLTDIQNTTPTLALREGVVNEIVDRRLFILPRRIDTERSLLEDVTIFDNRDPMRSRTIYADSGTIAIGREDLYLTLFEGWMHETSLERKAEFHRTNFRTDHVRIPGVARAFERDTTNEWRGDRELPIDSMRIRSAETRVSSQGVSAESRALAVSTARRLLATLADGGNIVEPFEAMDPASEDSLGAQPAATDSIPWEGATKPEIEAWNAGQRLRNPSGIATAFKTRAVRQRLFDQRANRYEVEIQKKYSIPAAILVFVIIGAPIAVRYRRGGIALVVGVSLVVFCAYYIALIVGEDLADRQFVSPFWAMWFTNVAFGLFGLAMFWRQRRAGA